MALPAALPEALGAGCAMNRFFDKLLGVERVQSMPASAPPRFAGGWLGRSGTGSVHVLNRVGDDYPIPECAAEHRRTDLPLGNFGPSQTALIKNVRVERPVSAASPEVDEDDDTGDRRARAPHRGKGISLDRVDNHEN